MHITDGQTDGWTDRQTDGRTEKWSQQQKTADNTNKNTIADYSIALQKREVRAYNAMKWYL